MNEQSRINAMISYFFLGPLFLLARQGTPLAEPYVRGHAMRSSRIIGSAFLAYLIYAFFLRGFIDFSILGIHIHDILLSVISLVMIIWLIRGSYDAYRGVSAGSVVVSNSLRGKIGETSLTDFSEEQKIRIVASMIPFVGIYMARKYEDIFIIRGRVLGSFLGCIMIFGSIFSGSGGLIMAVCMILSTLIFVIISVHILLRSEFVAYESISRIPTYEEVETHFFSSMRTVYDFFRVAFGGKNRKTYREIYDEELSLRGEKYIPKEKFFMPAALLGLPVWNIFGIPSLWIEQYREYREYIISGGILTLLVILIGSIGGSSSPYLLFLIFPAVHMMNYASHDLHSYIPGIHIITRLIKVSGDIGILFYEKKQHSEISFHYTTDATSEKK